MIARHAPFLIKRMSPARAALGSADRVLRISDGVVTPVDRAAGESQTPAEAPDGPEDQYSAWRRPADGG